MAKQSGFAAQIEREKIIAMRAARHLELIFCADCMCIALGELGFGEKRLKEVEEKFSEVYEKYDRLREADGKDDRNNWYYHDTIDADLRQYTGKWFVPYEERYYGELRKLADKK